MTDNQIDKELLDQISSVLIAFRLLSEMCEHSSSDDPDCHHPDKDFSCVLCAPCNCPLLESDPIEAVDDQWPDALEWPEERQ